MALITPELRQANIDFRIQTDTLKEVKGLVTDGLAFSAVLKFADSGLLAGALAELGERPNIGVDQGMFDFDFSDRTSAICEAPDAA